MSWIRKNTCYFCRQRCCRNHFVVSGHFNVCLFEHLSLNKKTVLCRIDLSITSSSPSNIVQNDPFVGQAKMMGWNGQVPNKSQGIVNENRRNLATLWKMAHTRVSECFCVSCRHQSQKGSFVRFQILISLFLFFKATYIFSSDQITVILWCFGLFYRKNQQGATTAVELRYGLIAMLEFDFTLTSMRSFEVTSYIWPSEYFV